MDGGAFLSLPVSLPGGVVSTVVTGPRIGSGPVAQAMSPTEAMRIARCFDFMKYPRGKVRRTYAPRKASAQAVCGRRAPGLRSIEDVRDAPRGRARAKRRGGEPFC